MKKNESIEVTEDVGGVPKGYSDRDDTARGILAAIALIGIPILLCFAIYGNSCAPR